MSILHRKGEETFPLPATALWARLRDLHFLAESLPDLESVTPVTAGEVRVTVRPGLAFLRGTLEVTLRLLQETAPQMLHLAVTSQGLAHASEAQVQLHLLPMGESTRLQWTVEVVQLSGLLQTLPRGLLQGTTDRVIKDILERLRHRLISSAALPPSH